MVDRSVATIRRSHLMRLAREGKRLDGRDPDQMRRAEIATGVISDYDGSARIRLGGTELIVGVHIEKGRPYPNLPESGTMHTKLQLHPIASPRLGKEDTDLEATEISRVIDRGIRNSGAVDLGELCITPGEEAWTLFVDLLVLDFDGNLFDASHLGILKVLKETKFPASDNGTGDEFPVLVKGLPVSTTFVKMGDSIFLDPTALEERVADARISMVCDEAGNIRSIQKGGRGGFTASDIKEVFRHARETSDRLRKGL